MGDYMKILAINPGSTSTKIAVFEDESPLFTEVIRHSTQDLSKFSKITDQYEFRNEVILKALQEHEIDLEELDAVVGRGGLLKPIKSGVYKVNETMLNDLRIGVQGEHASNLGGILANEITKNIKTKEVPAFIVDPVVVDELDDIARFSGLADIQRTSIFHALNQKAVARHYARDIGKKYEELNLLVAHLGGGITVGAHHYGLVIDVNNGLDGEGPFSPERSGALPATPLAILCFSGKYQLPQLKKKIAGEGGLVSYLGTNDARIIEKRAYLENDSYCRQVFEAMAYQIAKEIGAYATVLKGEIDAILLTGGLAYSEILIKLIKEWIDWIAPIQVYPGEDELQALAENARLALSGEVPIKEYT
ncbi:MAG TPA: butyrate kinase [Candidatus Kapabacteria bacterium]|jgi:butyrate kinase|nr:butyrate kinase [Candidatus Kapabacteria bacterium]HOV92682.1 butyrate kinase [Candidatus Kapabacteria bacterium]